MISAGPVHFYAARTGAYASLCADWFVGAAVAEANDECGTNGSQQVADEVPAGVRVITDVVVWQDECCQEFDDFVHPAKTHGCGDANQQHAKRGAQLMAGVDVASQ